VRRKERALHESAPELPTPQRWYPSPAGHAGFGLYDALAPLGVTVLRQPEQRLISGHRGLHGWHLHGSQPQLREYAERLKGCQVRMLARGGRVQCDFREAPPSEAETGGAVALLKQFQFVGITEEWELTVCLWHRMFGGDAATSASISAPKPWWHRCNATQFHNFKRSRGGAYDTSALIGFRDEPDHRLYAMAKYLFRRRLARFNVTHTACAPCYAQAGQPMPTSLRAAAQPAGSASEQQRRFRR
jgi:hypothetical protein